MLRWHHILAIVAIPVLIYGGGYLVVRQTHTWYWVDKEHDNRVNYTLFDTYSPFDDMLYVVFYPACRVDRAVTGRYFEQDKF